MENKIPLAELSLSDEYGNPTLADHLPMKVLFGKRPKTIGYVSVLIFPYLFCLRLLPFVFVAPLYLCCCMFANPLLQVLQIGENPGKRCILQSEVCNSYRNKGKGKLTYTNVIILVSDVNWCFSLQLRYSNQHNQRIG